MTEDDKPCAHPSVIEVARCVDPGGDGYREFECESCGDRTIEWDALERADMKNDARVQMYCPSDDLATWRAAAEREKITISEWLRRAARAQLEIERGDEHGRPWIVRP
jgi:hypothetical protein